MSETITRTSETQSVRNIEQIEAAQNILALQARAQNERLMDLLCDGEISSIPADVDPISSARRAAQGNSTARHQAAVDSYSTIDEAVAQTSGSNAQFFEPYRLRWMDGDFSTGEQSITDIAWSGISPLGSHEEARQTEAEFIEAGTLSHFVNEDLHDKYNLVTVSLPSERETHIMIRFVAFVEQDRDLVMRAQQIALPDGAQLRSKIEAMYALSGVNIAGMSRQEVLVNQLMTDASENDNLASWLSSSDILSDAEIRDIEFATQRRKELVETCAPRLGKFMMQLAERDEAPDKAKTLVQGETRRIILQATINNPELAREVFGDTIGDLSEKYVRASNNDDNEQMESLLNKVDSVAPQAMYCGVGSCGIDSVSPIMKLAAEGAGLRGEVGYVDEAMCGRCGTKGLVMEIKVNGDSLCVNGCGKTRKSSETDK